MDGRILHDGMIYDSTRLTAEWVCGWRYIVDSRSMGYEKGRVSRDQPRADQGPAVQQVEGALGPVPLEAIDARAVVALVWPGWHHHGRLGWADVGGAHDRCRRLLFPVHEERVEVGKHRADHEETLYQPLSERAPASLGTGLLWHAHAEQYVVFVRGGSHPLRSRVHGRDGCAD